MSTDKMISLPFFNGCKYVAYSSNLHQVSLFDSINCKLNLCIAHQVGAVNWFEKMPDFLAYHINSFHVVDIKVLKKKNHVEELH